MVKVFLTTGSDRNGLIRSLCMTLVKFHFNMCQVYTFLVLRFLFPQQKILVMSEAAQMYFPDSSSQPSIYPYPPENSNQLRKKYLQYTTKQLGDCSSR